MPKITVESTSRIYTFVLDNGLYVDFSVQLKDNKPPEAPVKAPDAPVEQKPPAIIVVDNVIYVDFSTKRRILHNKKSDPAV